jgi:hypothetical protein
VTRGVNIRKGPGVGNSRLGTLPKGARLEVVPDEEGNSRDGNWIHLKGYVPGHAQAIEGWVHQDYVKVETVVPPLQAFKSYLAGLEGEEADNVQAFAQKHILSSPNASRAAKAYMALQELQQAHPERLTQDLLQTLTRGVAEPRLEGHPSGAEGILNLRQVQEAAEALCQMPDADYQRLTQLLNRTAQPSAERLENLPSHERAAILAQTDPQAEAALLLKAVASRWDNDLQRWQPPTAWDKRRGDEWLNLWKNTEGEHDPLQALTWFANEIRATPRDSLVQQTSALDLNGDEIDEALQQRYTNSCGPTVCQIMRAELDPIFGAWLHREELHSGDPHLSGRYGYQNNSTDNISEQGRLLSSYGSFSKGSYIYKVMDNFVDDYSDVRYTTQFINKNSIHARLDHLTELLHDGYDVPIRVQKSGSSSAHFMLFTDVRGEGNDRSYFLTDPWTGRSAWVPQQNILSGDWDHKDQTDDGFLWDGDYNWTSMYVPLEP